MNKAIIIAIGVLFGNWLIIPMFTEITTKQGFVAGIIAFILVSVSYSVFKPSFFRFFHPIVCRLMKTEG